MDLQCRSVAYEDGLPDRPKVLIADDDPECLSRLERAFRGRGLPIIRCHDGGQAWQALQDHPGISVAVMNWMLPGLDGYLICRRLHELRSSVVPVLMVGQNFLREIRMRLRVQPRFVLAKPFPVTGIDPHVGQIVRAAFLRRSDPPLRLACGADESRPDATGHLHTPAMDSEEEGFRAFA
jgi:DNA-binding response OmpR family regulator